jgi:hypothetical protein
MKQVGAYQSLYSQSLPVIGAAGSDSLFKDQYNIIMIRRESGRMNVLHSLSLIFLYADPNDSLLDAKSIP